MNDVDKRNSYQGTVREDNDPRRYFIDWIDNSDNPKILDVGCACGDFAVSLKNEKPCEIWGMEYNEKSIEVAKATGGFVDVFLVDLNKLDVEDFSDFCGFFDYIVFGDVLEHMLEPQFVVEQFKAFLKKNGFFLISLPNVAHASIKANLLLNNFDYTELGLLDRTHVRFFTYKTICSFLSDLKLDIVDCKCTFIWPTGFQKNNPFIRLSGYMKRYILRDRHSYVCQYVLKCSIDSGAAYGKNLDKLSLISVPNRFLQQAFRYVFPRSLRAVINFVTLLLPKKIRHRGKARCVSSIISDDCSSQKRIAVHFHLFYADTCKYFYDNLKNLAGVDYDLFVSTPCPELVNEITTALPGARVSIVENRGYDIGAFIEFINKINLFNYDFVLKIHTKSISGCSLTLNNGKDIDRSCWRDLLVENLIGSPKIIEQNIGILKNNDDIGMIGARDLIFHDDYWLDGIRDILNKIGIPYEFETNTFIAGSMFLVKSKLLQPLKNIYSIKDFVPSKINVNHGTLAHSVERLLGTLIIAQGYKIHGCDYSRVIKFIKNRSNWVLKRKRLEDRAIVKIFNRILFEKKYFPLRKEICLFGMLKFSFNTSRKNIQKLFANMLTGKSDFFVEELRDNYIREEKDAKLIAYYLPQFYRFKENDEWHGKGFTEWTNVTKSLPLYVGHYQPHLPLNGFYHLNLDTMKEQAELAQKYGIYGFCFYYYWFSGTKIMEKPILELLNCQEIDIPFMICWTNENWNKKWDGTTNELLMEQRLEDDDGERFFHDILPFFNDRRYIRVNDCPVLMIYQSSFFPKEKLEKFIKDIRNLSKLNGFKDLYITTSNLEHNPLDYGIDAIMEFPPHGMKLLKKFRTKKVIQNSRYNVYDLKDYVKNKKFLYDSNYRVFKCVFPGWDNSPRRAKLGCVIYDNGNPSLYKEWLMECIKYTNETHPVGDRIIMINAWNEWAEGAHLEPDRKFGYAYLQATREALEESRNL
ncbi:MAG: glycoside hydrolase family 99-like domain-containing protein [Holosporaceae bacterium]|jgi:lipopolysaccharide biosynthesis protein/2-polyprenyl-3-methyl-5-hydroxy-6-metoxy-1,4-benzoquinol methylase|nr:glycoside hydrolase family 99-like domain-containing protein [Holosporaceae bacterium]